MTLHRSTPSTSTILLLILALGGIVFLKQPTVASAQSEPGTTYAQNVLLNSQFKSVDYGAATTVRCWNAGQSSGGCDGGTFFANRWRSKVAKPGTEATLSTNSGHSGGVDVNLSTKEADYIYLRQSIPGIEQFIGETLTMRVELDNASDGLQYDIYVNARFNKNDDDGRTNVEDSMQLPLSTSSQVIYQTLDLTGSTLTDNNPELDASNSLEAAFRIYAPTSMNASVSIKNISIYHGTGRQGTSFSDPSYEAAQLAQWYETSEYVTPTGGLGNQRGQKRAFFPFVAEKRLGSDYRLSFSDATGQSGVVSGYTASGTRIDGVQPTAISKTSKGFVVVLNDTDLVGFGASWVADGET